MSNDTPNDATPVAGNPAGSPADSPGGDAPTERFDVAGSNAPTVTLPQPVQEGGVPLSSAANKSRTLLYVLISLGGALLVALFILIMVLLTRGETPVVTPSSTASESPSASPTPTETVASPSPTPSETATAAPPPAPTGPTFASFAGPSTAGCQAGDTQKQLTFIWSSTDAVRAFIGVATFNAKAEPYASNLPATFTYTDLYYNCDQASQFYTVTLEDSQGRLTHETVTTTP